MIILNVHCCSSPLTGAVPYKVKVKVLEAKPAVTRDDGTNNRHVTVEGGINVLAPAHIKTGDVIVVRTHDNSYMSKE